MKFNGFFAFVPVTVIFKEDVGYLMTGLYQRAEIMEKGEMTMATMLRVFYEKSDIEPTNSH